jgi:hypothetical protein
LISSKSILQNRLHDIISTTETSNLLWITEFIGMESALSIRYSKLIYCSLRWCKQQINWKEMNSKYSGNKLGTVVHADNCCTRRYPIIKFWIDFITDITFKFHGEWFDYNNWSYQHDNYAFCKIGDRCITRDVKSLTKILQKFLLENSNIFPIEKEIERCKGI